MSSLFGDWGEAELAQVYFQEEIPESIKFKHFFRIRDVDILKKLILLKRPGVCGEEVKPAARVESHYAGVGAVKRFIVFQLKKTESVKLLLRDLIYGTGFWRSDNFLEWLKSFSPEVIFFVGGNSVFSFKIAVWLSSYLRVPLDIYITDDYIVNAKPKGVVARSLHERLLRTYRLAFSKARNVFVIGEDMAGVFSRFFDRECVAVMNSVSIPPALLVSESAGRGIDFVYAGGLHLGRDRALVAFSDILKRVSEASGRECSLTVYSGQSLSAGISNLFLQAGIVFGGALDQVELKERLAASDFVLHVESFAEKYAALTKLSVSTKIPECLISGSCLVAFGPRELASIRLVEKYGVGICLTDLNGDRNSELALVKAILEGEFRMGIIKNGFDFAKREFDEVNVRSKFCNLINQ